MQTDTLAYDTLSQDSLNNRPLPKWLVDQKSGVTTVQAEELVMREDNSLRISFFVTGILILVLVTLLTFYSLRKNKKQAQ